MTLHDPYDFQQVMVRAYVLNLMAFATLPLLFAQAMRRDHAGSASRTGAVVSIAAHSFRAPRDRKDRAAAGAVLNYCAFARRVNGGLADGVGSAGHLSPRANHD
jgi:hypothetical protein